MCTQNNTPKIATVWRTGPLTVVITTSPVRTIRGNVRRVVSGKRHHFLHTRKLPLHNITYLTPLDTLRVPVHGLKMEGAGVFEM